VARFIGAHECGNIGLKFGGNNWEYPLWVLIEKYAKRMPRIEHVGVRNKSAKRTPVDFEHCIEVRFKNNKLIVTLSIENFK
jgi:hypothetical protein